MVPGARVAVSSHAEGKYQHFCAADIIPAIVRKAQIKYGQLFVYGLKNGAES